jgi:hypothetical protein
MVCDKPKCNQVGKCIGKGDHLKRGHYFLVEDLHPPQVSLTQAKGGIGEHPDHGTLPDGLVDDKTQIGTLIIAAHGTDHIIAEGLGREIKVPNEE